MLKKIIFKKISSYQQESEPYLVLLGENKDPDLLEEGEDRVTQKPEPTTKRGLPPQGNLI